MMETRKIVAAFEELPATKDVAFPSVRVWIKGLNDYETQGLRQSFPDRGTVFLHVSASEGHHPVRNQIGLFNCEPSPGEKAAWKVRNTSRHLAKVIRCPIWDLNPHPLAFWEWLTTYKDTTNCNILLGDGTVLVRRGKTELVGPFFPSLEGKLVSRRQVFSFEGVEVLTLNVGGRRLEFFDAELLPEGQPLILGPKEAIQRRLKLAHSASHLHWLSRAKMQELSAALEGITVADGSEWVMDTLPRALELLSSSGDLDKQFAEAILQNKQLEDGLEAVWKLKHAESIKSSGSEIEELKNTAAEIKTSVEGSTKDLARIQKEKNLAEGVLAELKEKIDGAKADAATALDAELRRLAKSPATMALFAAWGGGVDRALDRVRPITRIQRFTEERPPAMNLRIAIINNLRACGLSPISAVEVAVVSVSSLASGQPIAFRSLCGDLLAEAVATALGQPSVVWVDVPAGLLDPVDWDSTIPPEHKKDLLILQGANRSDVPLVLGSRRSLLLRQALGHQKPSELVILTLETSSELQVQSDLQFGSLIDDRMLRFGAPKTVTPLSAFPEYAKDLGDVAPVSEDEFAEIGEAMQRLPIFASSVQRFAFRRSLGALRNHSDKPADVARLFFKYWCWPRLSLDDARSVLVAHKEVWQQDRVLGELTQSLTDNE